MGYSHVQVQQRSQRNVSRHSFNANYQYIRELKKTQESFIKNDSDFAGLWLYEDKTKPVSVKSRMGFAMRLADCPIVWGSKLVAEIAMSTMEAEYMGLSMCMRHIIPLQRTIRRLAEHIGMIRDSLTTFKTKVHEDNAGALTLANLEPGRETPRSKHYAVKYHWFREHLKPDDNGTVDTKVVKIDTEIQLADILTKGLRTKRFQEVRRLLCGW